MNDGDVNIDNIAVFQCLIVGYAVADDVIHGRADRFGEAAIVQTCRNGLLLVDDELVANPVQFLGGHAGPDMLGNHIEHVCGQPPGYAHMSLLLQPS